LLKGLGSIVMKEIKELVRDPKILVGMIIVPLIIFPLMGFAITTSQQSAQQSLKQVRIAVANFDNGSHSQGLINYLEINTTNLVITQLSVSNETQALDYMRNSNSTALIVIPQNFSTSINAHEKGVIEVFSVFVAASLTEQTTSQLINSYLNTYNSLYEPFVTEQESIVKGTPVAVDPQVLFGFVFSQIFIMPFTILMLLIFAMQLASTSVAMEKEEKTLETLLTAPIDRFTILAGKLTGSIVVAILGAAAYLVGFTYYFNSFSFASSAGTSVDLAALGLTPSLLGYVLIGASLFVSLLSALALAVVISAFADDVRGAQSLVGFLYILFILPMFFMMFSDINNLPLGLRIVLLAIPYTHPMLAAKATITGDYLLAALGVVYVSIFTVVVLYIAARLFATEKILTMKLRFRGFRRVKEQPTEELE